MGNRTANSSQQKPTARTQAQAPAPKSAPRTSLAKNVLIAVVVVAAALLLGFVGDKAANQGKAYTGVWVEQVDVSGLNREQIIEKLKHDLDPKVFGRQVSIYASQQALENKAENTGIDDFTSVDEAYENMQRWDVNAQTLEATIDYSQLADMALEKGRGSLLERAGLFFGTAQVAAQVNFNPQMVEELAARIDHTLGDPFVNSDILCLDGHADVIEGHDGYMVDRNQLADKLSRAFLAHDDAGLEFVAELVHTPQEVNAQLAQEAADVVNRALAAGADFTCEGDVAHVDTFQLCQWLQTTVEHRPDGSAYLQPYFLVDFAKDTLLRQLRPSLADASTKVSFSGAGDSLKVHVIESEGVAPRIAECIEHVNEDVFGYGKGGKSAPAQEATEALRYEIETMAIPETMSFDEALLLGVIIPISTYTTEYTYGQIARNTNIHLAADLISDSVAPANGGIWSFNDIAGECNEEKGFMAAQAIADDEVVDEIGGGICQVATTVFNAVYLAGFTFKERQAHTNYIASYPAGRDAAVSWPYPDLKWSNDSASDVLLRTSYTDTTVTVGLYGVDPGYTVSIETGEWQLGTEYQTVYVNDPELAKGLSYVKQFGSVSRSISVTRYVHDSEGVPVRSDVYTSSYPATNEVIVVGAM